MGKAKVYSLEYLYFFPVGWLQKNQEFDPSLGYTRSCHKNKAKYNQTEINKSEQKVQPRTFLEIGAKGSLGLSSKVANVVTHEPLRTSHCVESSRTLVILWTYFPKDSWERRGDDTSLEGRG